LRFIHIILIILNSILLEPKKPTTSSFPRVLIDIFSFPNEMVSHHPIAVGVDLACPILCHPEWLVYITFLYSLLRLKFIIIVSDKFPFSIAWKQSIRGQWKKLKIWTQIKGNAFDIDWLLYFVLFGFVFLF